MTKRRVEDEESSEESDFADSSASETEEEDEPEDPETELRTKNAGSSVRLSKFFQEIDVAKKYSPMDTGNKAGIQFEKNMYRVIPMRLDPSIPKLRNLIDRGDTRR
ncbi:uncharacterized protein LOC144467976 [Augochlora pura]